MTIPAADHGMTGIVSACNVFALVSEEYLSNCWAARETYATVSENGDIILHYPQSSGYAGAAALTSYDVGTSS